MIDPKELRIGNIINSQGLAMVVSGIYELKILYRQLKPKTTLRHPSDLGANPIPLTNEILLKTGFQYDETDEEYTIGSIDFEASEEDADRHFCLWSENKEDFECYFSDIPIKSVHQLQNLYFALTGKELDIKL